MEHKSYVYGMLFRQLFQLYRKCAGKLRILKALPLLHKLCIEARFKGENADGPQMFSDTRGDAELAEKITTLQSISPRLRVKNAQAARPTNHGSNW